MVQDVHFKTMLGEVGGNGGGGGAVLLMVVFAGAGLAFWAMKKGRR
jgi:hypothetical protein